MNRPKTKFGRKPLANMKYSRKLTDGPPLLWKLWPLEATPDCCVSSAFLLFSAAETEWGSKRHQREKIQPWFVSHHFPVKLWKIQHMYTMIKKKKETKLIQPNITISSPKNVLSTMVALACGRSGLLTLEIFKINKPKSIFEQAVTINFYRLQKYSKQMNKDLSFYKQ